jgi:hypothetical protein
MAANGYAFTLQASAQALVAPVDTALGYPKAGVDVGAGRHAPPAQSRTQTYATPALLSGQFWYPADTNTLPILTPLTVTLSLPAPAPIPVVVVVG